MPKDWFTYIDTIFITSMRRYGIFLLRITLGIVFIWFGALKVLGVSPVVELLRTTYSFFPIHPLLLALGWIEILIGACLIFKFFLRGALALLWIQMAGTFLTFVLNPPLFFSHGNIFFLTQTGEFVVKNFVFVASGIVIGGHEVE
ncbi:MAG: hypothetical protein HZA36_02375 [Parcubacteria group bacterium]|nr:hypothetical protein [Parcubacteria group bacterium]